MTSLVTGVSQVIEAGYLCVFTCANDYQDVQGESAIMKHVIGPNFLLSPTKSPFAACRYAALSFYRDILRFLRHSRDETLTLAVFGVFSFIPHPCFRLSVLM